MTFLKKIIQLIRGLFVKEEAVDGWWTYYNFESEPLLNIAPLESKEDIDTIFYGRTSDIEELKNYSVTKGITSILVLGHAGIGKTSLINRTFIDEKGYIRVNLGLSRDYDMIVNNIASQCIKKLKNLKGYYNDLQEDLINIKTTSYSGDAQVGGPVAKIRARAGVSFTLIDDFRYIEIFEKVFKRIRKKVKKIILLLDETDKLLSNDGNDLAILSSTFREYIKEPATIIVTNRDHNTKVSEEYNASNSSLSSSFDSKMSLNKLWNEHIVDSKKILEPRFYQGVPNEKYIYPLSNEATYWISIFSDGNIRDLVKYTRKVLIKGVNKNTEIPISDEFVLNILYEDLFNRLNLDDFDLKLLKYLQKIPSSSSDQALIKHMGKSTTRRTLLNRIHRLENMIFLDRDIKGKKDIYHTTKKAIKLLDLHTK